MSAVVVALLIAVLAALAVLSATFGIVLVYERHQLAPARSGGGTTSTDEASASTPSPTIPTPR